VSYQDTIVQRTILGERRMTSQVKVAMAVGLVAIAVFIATLVVSVHTGVPAAMPSSIPVATTDDDGDASADAGDDGSMVDSAVPLTTYEVFLARDPFEPVVPEPEPEATSGTGEATPGDEPAPSLGEAPAVGDPVVPPVTGQDPVRVEPRPGDDTCIGSEELVCNGQVLTLVDIVTANGEQVAVIQVDTTIYEVQRGQTFAGNYQLSAIDGSCIILLYGDDGFRLCRGDVVLK
jgi:hypothetical protein